MNLMRLAVSGLSLVAFLAPAIGHEVTIRNNAPVSIDHFSVRPGKVENFKRIGAGSVKTFNVTLPDGQCETKLRFSFDDGQTIDSQTVEICGGLVFTITNGKY